MHVIHTRCHDRFLTAPNAGGASEFSEFFAFCVLNKCFGSKLLFTEMEVLYFPYGSTMTDFVVSINNIIIAISVARVYPYRNTFTDEDINTLLIKKIRCIRQSNINTMTRWKTQVLFIWVPHKSLSHRVLNLWIKLNQIDIMIIIGISSNMKLYLNYQ